MEGWEGITATELALGPEAPSAYARGLVPQTCSLEERRGESRLCVSWLSGVGVAEGTEGSVSLLE